MMLAPYIPMVFAVYARVIMGIRAGIYAMIAVGLIVGGMVL